MFTSFEFVCRRGSCVWLLLLVLTTSSAYSSSSSISSSSYEGPPRRLPCKDNHNRIYLHGETFKMSLCSSCVCENSTLACKFLSCQPSRCSHPVTLKDACCRVCPYNMTVTRVEPVVPADTSIEEGVQNEVTLDLNVGYLDNRETTSIAGRGLWTAKLWMSSNEDGSNELAGTVVEEALTAGQQAWSLQKSWSQLFSIPGVRYEFDLAGYSCDEARYLCAKFDRGPNPAMERDYLDFYFQAIPTRQVLIGCTQVSCGDSMNRPDMISWLKIGARVVRGQDWIWDYQDGTPPGDGQITSALTKTGWISVRWDTGKSGQYRMGYEGKYDLQSADTDYEVRLVNGDDELSGQVEVNGDDELSGQVEVNRHGTWGTVCGVEWDIRDANVVCRQLADFLEAVEVQTGSFYGENERPPVLMNRVACEGKESRLSECQFEDTSYPPCSPLMVAGVVCRPKLNTVRLVGGPNPASGRVEIYHDGSWGSVCDDDWGMTDVQVVCRQLGFSGPVKAKTGAYFGKGDGPVHMQGVACDGSEDQLADCPFRCWKETTCSHSRDAAAICRTVGDVTL